MAYQVDPPAVLAGLSGLALALLGLLVLRLSERRLDRVAFGAFAVLWGAQIVAANLARMALDLPTVTLWLHAFLALQAVIFVPLAAFALHHLAPPKESLLQGRGALAALGLAAAGILGLFALQPALFVQQVSIVAGRGVAAFGPATAALIDVPFFLAFLLAVATMGRRYLGAGSYIHKARAALVLAAFAGYLGYLAPRGALLALLLPGTFSAGRAAALAPLTLLAAAVVAVMLLRVARHRAGGLPHRGLVLGLPLAAAATGLAEAAALAAGAPLPETLGAWRLGMVALIVYGIAHYQLFDAQLRLKAAAVPASYVLAAGLGLGALWTLAGSWLADTPLLAVAASVGVAASCAPVPRLARRALDHAAPEVRPDPEYLYRRKLEVYRAALEDARGTHAGEATEEVFLSNLRRSLGISEAEHRVLLAMLERDRAVRRPEPGLSPRFRVERELGRGAFARAVLATDTRLDRLVVLKQPTGAWLLDEEGRSRFLQEARLAARIHHPNVVGVYEILLDEEPPVIVMEYVEGGTLEARLGQERMRAADAARIVADVLRGLEQVHALGVVHRDLKPANVLLAADGTAKVGDFGIARPPRELAVAATIAVGQSQPGSLAYMSPEQARGDALDARSDLYAVGALLHRMLSGHHYLDLAGASEFRLRQLIQTAAPEPLPADVPPPLGAVVSRALAKHPADRFPGARAMREAVEAAAARAEAARAGSAA